MSHAKWREYRKCSSKRRYEHEAQAKSLAHRRGQKAYECSLCGGWHLASKS